MPGAGAFPASVGGAGLDPIATPSRFVPTPGAPFLDPATHQFVPTATGEIQGIHPVDQAVILAVCFPKGSHKSSPDDGLDWAAIRRASREAMQATVTDCVRNALARLITAGDIEFLGAPLVQNGNGRVLFTCSYVNRRLPGSVRNTVSVG